MDLKYTQPLTPEENTLVAAEARLQASESVLMATYRAMLEKEGETFFG